MKYLRSITTMTNLAYVIRRRDLEQTKVDEKLQILKEDFQKIYKGKGDYTIFETFWNNTGLRAELFPGLPLVITDKVESDSKIIFIDLVDTFNPKLYSFIQIK